MPLKKGEIIKAGGLLKLREKSKVIWWASEEEVEQMRSRGRKQMKVISSDNDREELTENWARRLISLIYCIFLLLVSTCCSRNSREGAGLAGTHLLGGCQACGKEAYSAPPRLNGKVERIVRKTPRRSLANLSWWYTERRWVHLLFGRKCS